MGKCKICERVKGGISEYKSEGPINIVIIGDSISHGCVGGGISHDYNTVYHNRLRLMINRKYPSIPVNIINTAIGGSSADVALANFERDVLPHKPDLVIICFGLNDVNGTVERYTSSLSGLFGKCKDNGADCIFMTPNMLNTRYVEGTEARFAEYALKTADMQNCGRMDSYMEAARSTAEKHGVTVCDCYAEWKAMEAEGVDTTLLLANYINHPTREMHKLFADMLYETIFGEKFDGENVIGDDGMIKL